jgi:hypothetical protein
LGSGVNTRIMGGAGLLFLTNLVAIVASAFAVFLLLGMNSKEVHSDAQRSRWGDALIRKYLPEPLVRALTNGVHVRWRILILLVLLGTVAVPLRTALLQVAGEAKARGAVQDVVKRLVPSGTLVSQQVEIGKESVAVRLIATRSIPDDKLHLAEREIEARTHWKTVVSVASIASQSELAELMQRFSAPPAPAPPPKEKTLEEIQRELMDRVQATIEDLWPSEAPVEGFDVAFGSNGILLNVSYSGKRALDKISLSIIERQVRDKLHTPGLSLNARRVQPSHKQTAGVKR